MQQQEINKTKAVSKDNNLNKLNFSPKILFAVITAKKIEIMAETLHAFS